jgi:hypothetical protein
MLIGTAMLIVVMLEVDFDERLDDRLVGWLADRLFAGDVVEVLFFV